MRVSLVSRDGRPMSCSAARPHPEPKLGVDRRARAHADVGHVDAEPDLRLELARGDVEVEAAQDERERDRRLHHRELVADALARAAAERQERVVGRDLVGVQPVARVGVVAAPARDRGRGRGLGAGVCRSSAPTLQAARRAARPCRPEGSPRRRRRPPPPPRREVGSQGARPPIAAPAAAAAASSARFAAAAAAAAAPRAAAGAAPAAERAVPARRVEGLGRSQSASERWRFHVEMKTAPPRWTVMPPPGCRTQRVVVERAPDEQRRLGVEPQALGQARARALERDDVVVAERLARADDAVDLVAHRGEVSARAPGRVEELVERPREQRGGRLVARDEHRHEVVAQLLVVRLLAAHVDEEAQQRRVVGLARLEVLRGPPPRASPSRPR